MSTETIVAAAIMHANGTVYWLPPPARHYHVISHMQSLGVYEDRRGEHEQGFLTSTGRFLRRAPARRIAEAAGQLLPHAPLRGSILTSEDLW